MSSNNPQLPPSFNYNDGGVSGFWPHLSPNTEEFENEHSFKRARSDSTNNVQVLQTNGSSQPMGNGYGNRHIFYKTRICQPFMEGKCWMGADRCSFAHGQDDLRESLQNWQGTSKGSSKDDERIIQRMRICRKFYNGNTCPYGDQCNFLHEEPSKFRTTAAAADINKNQQYSDQVNSGGKTRLCAKWEETGFCPLGEGCQLAHGVLELQQPGVGSIDAENVDINRILTKPDEGTWKPKWNKPRKINGIYGDWIDNVELPQKW